MKKMTISELWQYLPDWVEYICYNDGTRDVAFLFDIIKPIIKGDCWSSSGRHRALFFIQIDWQCDWENSLHQRPKQIEEDTPFPLYLEIINEFNYIPNEENIPKLCYCINTFTENSKCNQCLDEKLKNLNNYILNQTLKISQIEKAQNKITEILSQNEHLMQKDAKCKECGILTGLLIKKNNIIACRNCHRINYIMGKIK